MSDIQPLQYFSQRGEIVRRLRLFIQTFEMLRKKDENVRIESLIDELQLRNFPFEAIKSFMASAQRNGQIYQYKEGIYRRV